MIISRLCLRVLTPNITHIYRIRTTLLTRIFVICDIVTFLIQVSGSGIASSGNWEGEVVDIGTNVLIAGLSLQIATFTFFVAIVARFHRITISGRVRDDAGDGWKPVLNAVYISSVLIIVSWTISGPHNADYFHRSALFIASLNSHWVFGDTHLLTSGCFMSLKRCQCYLQFRYSVIGMFCECPHVLEI